MNIDKNFEVQHIVLGDITLDVIYKNIKNVHLSVYPPMGGVRIAAPRHMNIDIIRVFAISKLSWIKKQREKFLAQKRESPREYISGESHYYNGKRYLLKVIEHNAAPKVEIKHERIEMRIRPGTVVEKRRRVLDEWYRIRLKETVPEIISKYEKIISVKVKEFGVKKMKTKWGTCNIEAGRIWLNLDLAKKPRHYIEYIVGHEMTHLLERCHNYRFTALMDEFMPKWRFYKEELNRLAISRIDWGS